MTLKKAAAKVRKAGFKNSGQDSILAHITPEEAQLLQSQGGSGRTDPHTGLPHFDEGVGSDGFGGAGFGDSNGFGGIGEGGFGLSDGFGGQSFGDADGFGVADGFGDVGTLNADNIGYDTSVFSDPAQSFSLSSMFGKNGKNGLMAALNGIGIPGLAPSVASMTAPNTSQATAAMGQGFLGSALGMLGNAFGGPIGGLVGSAFGNSMGKDFGNIPAMSDADNAAAHAPGLSAATPGGGQRDGQSSTGSGFGSGAINPGNFFKNFLTSVAGNGLNSAGRTLGGMFGGGTQTQPQASYPDGAQPNNSNLYSMITGQEQPQMSTPWNSMESQAPNMLGSSAGYFSPSGGDVSQPNIQAQGFSMPTMGQAGNFIGNNLGSLVTGLYGMYNNRRQQGQLSDQMRSLQSLYAPGSPYAKQLEAKIAANAAARGTRSNVAGREVQLQSGLADRAASTMPHMFQMQQGIGTLQNRELMNLLTMGKDTGLFKSLGSLFQSGG